MLDEILSYKRRETEWRKQQYPIGELLDEARDESPSSFLKALTRTELSIIAEIKYSSPSHGPFHCQEPPEKVAESYSKNGAAALSVLTDEKFFSGSLDYLRRVRTRLQEIEERCGQESEKAYGESESASLSLPLLRKDFILDRYQIAEARAYGASACLLIAAALQQGELIDLMEYGSELELEALVEVHDPFELEAALESGSKIIGVNNRNLKTFNVDINTSFDIARRMEEESDCILVAESGISTLSQLLELRDAGFSAFLIGATFMESDDPGKALGEILADA